MQKGGEILFRINFILIFNFTIIVSSYSQEPDFKQYFSKYTTENDSIINSKSLSSFFAKLKSVETSDSLQTINILHIGDSHIQADILTREIRNSLQNRFGNAGRGLVFPFRITRSNESFDFHSSTNSSWKWETVRNRKRNFEPGIAGASMQCNDDIFTFEMKLTNRDSLDNSFRKVKLICRNDSNGLLAFVTDKNDLSRQLIAFSGDTIYETKLNNLTDRIEIQSVGNVLIDGLVLENEKKGIQYHVVGINGAHYADYNKSKTFFAEMPFLQPDLILISLGTNEGVNAGVSSQVVVNETDKMIQNIRLESIDAPIVIITPFDNFYHRKKNNRYLSVVRNGLLTAAEKNNIACMDMYGISGGFGSVAAWRRQKLITSDGIHYTISGYKLQGKMIYNTLINSYSNYASR